ncbi:MAG TPA: NAD(P)H-dependent oxidoreductase [Polyangiaceae bacterium]|jgi:NAD(P)H-dependent FMN reductase|nr:NAD(P)H-dependent oxidoreductase [Polyangiaceae bacterium]
MQFLAVCGSLRGASTNLALLEAAIELAPPGVSIEPFDGLAQLPHYNPDCEESLPPAAAAWRALVGRADGLLLSSPEYAFGVPGSLKNALDWLVGGAEFVGKPIALLGASPRAVTSRESLVRTLTAMAGRIVEEASITLPLLGRKLDAAALLADPALREPLEHALAAFVESVKNGRDR